MRKQEQPPKEFLGGFRRYSPQTKSVKDRELQPVANMGTAFSRGDGSHLPPMKVGNSVFVTETQADQLRQEVIVEQMDHDAGCWECEDPEAGGIVHVDTPEKSLMVRVKVTGQAIVYLDAAGKLVVDSRGY